MKPSQTKTRALCLTLALATALPAAAQTAQETQNPQAPPPPPIRLHADRLQDQAGITEADGTVKAEWGDYRLCAAKLTYDRATGLIRAVQDVRLTSPGSQIAGDRATYDLTRKEGEFGEFTVTLAATRLRLQGDRADWRASGLSAQDVRITSCPAASEDWRLHAGEVEILADSQEFIARDTVMKIMDIPVLYLPYGRFYYGEERHSGFLRPDFRLGSDSGAGIVIPYYFSLAPHYDLTLIPNYRNKHGLELGGEFRFLTPQTRGDIQLATALFDDSTRDRQAVNFAYAAGPWRAKLQAENISDDDYLRDYADSDRHSARLLPRRFSADYRRGNFHAGINADHHKALDGVTAPPAIAPRLWAGYDSGGDRHDWRAQWEGTRFRHPHYRDWDAMRHIASADLRATGRLRGLAISPQIGFHAARYSAIEANPHVENGGYLVPHAKLEFAHTRRRQTPATTATPGPTRDHLRLRAAAVYAPANRRQNRLPNFDAQLRAQTPDNLFHWNRFSGSDRAGDAKFLAYSATYHRHAGAQETFYFSAAQQYHLADAVSLGDYHHFGRPTQSINFDQPPQQGFGNIIISSRLRLRAEWRAEASAEWDSDEKTIDRFYMEARGKFAVNKLAYTRYLNDGNNESLIIGGALPLASWLELAAKTDYLLDEDHFSRSELAVRLRDSCACWTISLGVKDRVITENKNDLQISFGMEFTDLASIGSNYDTLLSTLQ